MILQEHFSPEDFAILKDRARRVVSASHDDDSAILQPTLDAFIGDRTYVLPIDMLTAIHDETEVVRVPKAPSFVCGVANIRGRIIPVLDLGVLLGIRVQPLTGMPVLVGASDDHLTITLAVDRVGAIRTIPAQNLDPVPPGLGLVRSEYLMGTLPDGTILIDINAILADPGIMVNISEIG